MVGHLVTTLCSGVRDPTPVVLESSVSSRVVLDRLASAAGQLRREARGQSGVGARYTACKVSGDRARLYTGVRASPYATTWQRNLYARVSEDRSGNTTIVCQFRWGRVVSGTTILMFVLMSALIPVGVVSVLKAPEHRISLTADLALSLLPVGVAVVYLWMIIASLRRSRSQERELLTWLQRSSIP
jgi:uncharacterized MnhB-related membrane protein